jgi:hypothetical protein
MKPRWLPDWRNQAAYPNHATGLQWAWEFLRRNEQYQRLWKKLVKPKYTSAELEDAWKRAQGMRSNPAKSWFADTAVDDPWREFKMQFHIVTYPPPPPDEPQAKLQFQPYFIRYEINIGNDNVGWKIIPGIEPDEIVLYFNLDWPIGTQLANAKKVLKHHAPKQRRVRATKYKHYLRTLDAKAAGASLKQVAHQLHPKISPLSAIQTVRDHLEAAQRLRDRDYWLIAASQE